MKNIFVVLLLALPHFTSAQFLEEFDLNPPNPQNFYGAENWAIFVHDRDNQYTLANALAHHGPNCEPPVHLSPADTYDTTHVVNDYEATCYSCKNHLMTSIRSDGYGLIHLVPNQMADFSQQEAVVRIDISTMDEAGTGRDWFSFQLSPYDDFNPLSVTEAAADLQGRSKNTLWIETGYTNGLRSFEVKFTDDNFNTRVLPIAGYEHLEDLISISKIQRTPFELRISQNSVKFGIQLPEDHPSGNEYYWWVDATTHYNTQSTDEQPINFAWTEAVVQFGHYSYNPRKNGLGIENTWHWDNAYIHPAKPFNIINTNARYADANSPTLYFDTPAPANAKLVFAAPDWELVGGNLALQFGNNPTWYTPTRKEASSYDCVPGSYCWNASYSFFEIDIPQGTAEVTFNGADNFAQNWMAKDVYILSPSVPAAPIALDICAILEGCYDASSGNMTNTLESMNLLPSNQPYNSEPWSYTGTETLNTTDVADWVLVSFRTGTAASTEIAKTAALLQRDGCIYFPDSDVLPSGFNTPVYIVVMHRNHIAAMTPQPVSIINNTLTYDFRTAQSYIVAGSYGQKQLASGDWCMFAGDINPSDIGGYDINGNDKSVWTTFNGLFSDYFPADLNQDGDVNGADKGVWLGNNGIFSAVPK